MRRYRIFALLLALALLAGAAPPARCAGQPTVVCETGGEDGTVSLRLEGLDGSGVYGVQVELVLAGEYPGCVFASSSQRAYSPDCLAEIRQGNTAVTVYLTDRTALNRGTVLDLGELDLGTAGAVDWNVLPDTAGVILLDQQLRPMSGSMSGSLPVTATAPAGTPHVPPDGPSKPAEVPQLPPDTAPVRPPFPDVAEGDWYYSAVQYVYAHGIMSGMDDGFFAPNQATTRGMIVTMLHRLEDSPAALPSAFSDVPAGAYYAGPVAWASGNGLVTGIGDGLFAPETPITREQLAAILYRFVLYKGLDVTARADLGVFHDAASVSLYAAGPISWAVAAGLMTGSEGALDPGGNATRAQVATIFQRLCANLLGMV